MCLGNIAVTYTHFFEGLGSKSPSQNRGKLLETEVWTKAREGRSFGLPAKATVGQLDWRKAE